MKKKRALRLHHNITFLPYVVAQIQSYHQLDRRLDIMDLTIVPNNRVAVRTVRIGEVEVVAGLLTSVFEAVP